MFLMSALACSMKYDLPAIIFQRDQVPPLQPRTSPPRGLEAIVEWILELVVFGCVCGSALGRSFLDGGPPFYAWLAVGGGICRMSSSRALFVTRSCVVLYMPVRLYTVVAIRLEINLSFAHYSQVL